MHSTSKKPGWQTLVVVLLVMALLMGSVPQAVTAEVSTDNNGGIGITKPDEIPDSTEYLKDSHGTVADSKLYADDEKVTIIVELEDAPLIEDASYMQRGSSGRLLTYKGVQRSRTIKAAQANVQKKIASTVTDDGVFEVKHNYSVLMNGFSAVVEYRYLEAIRSMVGVKAAYVAPVYEIEPDAATSGEMVGASELWNNSGYRGQGTRIAIIDSGIDVDHELFRDAPESPAIDVEGIRQALENNPNLQAKLMNPNVTAEQLYLSAKIPFAFDYAEGVANADHRGGNTHGTHVAGIAAGNDGVNEHVVGMAPEAQLYIMKTMSNNVLSFDAVLAALEDCVMLDVDVINMSLGSAAGFTEDQGVTSVDGVYSRLGMTGIFIATSAGNSYNSGYRNRWSMDFPKLSDPDNGITGMPGTYKESTAVASVDNKVYMSDYFEVSGQKIAYFDNVPVSSALSFTKLVGQELEYIAIPGGGAPEDYDGLDVTGKVVLIQRKNGLSFKEKHDYAKAAGALALVVYDDEDYTWVAMQIDGQSIPSVLISKANGQFMLSQETKILTAKAGLFNAEYPFAGQMSEFSSWGPTSNLHLKPEISAPGGNIYSAVNGNSYSSLSGTSMASPNIAGLAALVKQYLTSDERFSELADTDMREMINTLLMNTAIPATYEDEFFGSVPFSPRRQGAGLANVNYAVLTNAYVTVDGMVRPKVELGDDPEMTGVYDMVFDLHNIGSTELRYELNAVAMTEFAAYDTTYYKPYMAGTPNPLAPIIESDWENNIVVVPAGETVRVNFKLSLSEGDRMTFQYGGYDNGMYIDGFVYFNATNEGSVDLSVPFLGFYGDWTKAPQLDHGYYWDTLVDADNNQASQYPHEASVDVNDFALYYLGDNMYHYLEYLADRNAISPNGDSKFDSLSQVHTSLLRNAKTLTYTVTGENGEEYYKYTVGNVSKTFFDANSGRFRPAGWSGWAGMSEWYGTDASNQALPNNTKATVRIEATLDYDAHESNNLRSYWEFPITVDLEKPELVSYRLVESEGQRKLHIEVKDNQYIADVSTYAIIGDMVDYRIDSFPGAAMQAGETLEFDLNIEGHDKIMLVVTDYAFNETALELDVPKDGFYVEPSKVEIYVEESIQLTAALYVPERPNENILDEAVSWESGDSAIATVTADGFVTAVSAGSTTIKATTVSGLSTVCALTVKPMSETPATVFNKEVYFGSYEQDADLENGVEPLQWRLLSNEGESVLLISEKIIGIRPYVDWKGQISETTNWEQSDVRAWMNGELYEAMFAAVERTGVAVSNVTADLNSDYPTVLQGVDTQDKVFLLSYKEMTTPEYGFASSPRASQTRVAQMTPSVLKYLLDTGNVQSAYQMLRTMGINTEHVVYMNPDGEIVTDGAYSTTSNMSIRPAIRLDISRVAFTSDANGKPMNVGELNTMNIPSAAVKLSIYDENLTLDIVSDVPEVFYADDDALRVEYANASYGANHYVSATIVGTNGKILYYGKLAQVDSADKATGSFEIPLDMLAGGTYTLNLFSEQDNGEKRTDYVSLMNKFVFVKSDESAPVPEVYTVNFYDSFDDSLIEGYEVEAGGSVNGPAAPEHEGYAFVGWDIVMEDGSVPNPKRGTGISFTNVRCSIDCYAKYEPVPTTYYTVTLSHNENGTTDPVAGEHAVAANEYITIKLIPNEGCKLTSVTVDGVERIDDVVNGELTLKPAADTAVHASFGKLTIRLLGDVNGDGIISASDASAILRHLVGLEQLSGVDLLAANVDGDELITAADASFVLRHIVGLSHIEGSVEYLN